MLNQSFINLYHHFKLLHQNHSANRRSDFCQKTKGRHCTDFVQGFGPAMDYLLQCNTGSIGKHVDLKQTSRNIYLKQKVEQNKTAFLASSGKLRISWVKLNNLTVNLIGNEGLPSPVIWSNISTAKCKARWTTPSKSPCNWKEI